MSKTKLFLVGLVLAALVAVPAAWADSSTALDGYGSNAAKPVVQVKGASTSGSNTQSAAGAAESGPSALPFTGSDIGMFVLAGGVLVAIGFGLRRFGRDDKA